MKLQGSYTFPVTPETLWPLLLDPNILTAVIPGCQNLNPGSSEKISRKPVLSNTGAIGGNGRLHLQAQDTHTLLTYEGEAKTGGQLTSHATPLLETSARSLIRQSLENLDHITQHGQPSTPTPETPLAIETSSANILGGQQTTILIITALTTLTLIALFYFFTRKPTTSA